MENEVNPVMVHIRRIRSKFEKIDSLNLVITVNGKRRGEFEVPSSASEDEVLALAGQCAAKWLEGKEIIKQIYVSGKLVNFVIKG